MESFSLKRIMIRLIGLIAASSLFMLPTQPTIVQAREGRNAGREGTLSAGRPYPLQSAVLHTIELQNGEHFGWSVDIDGDIAVLGAPDADIYVNSEQRSDAGIVYIFKRDAAGVWVQDETLTGGTQAGSRFGAAVAVSGDTVIVSAPDYDQGGDNVGAVLVYQRGLYAEGEWAMNGIHFSPRASPNDNYGYALDISGDLVVVGAANEDCSSCPSDDNSGSAFILRRNLGGTNNWGVEAELHTAVAQSNAHFGNAVAVHGEQVIVGAAWEDYGAVIDGGAAYIFSPPEPILPGQGLATPSWVLDARLVGSDEQSNDRYGYAVDIEANTALVGSIWEDGGPGDPLTDSGAAYVYLLSGEPQAWHETAILRAEDALGWDHFGSAVKLAGDRLVVGAMSENGGPADPLDDAGALYLFERNLGGENAWGQLYQILAYGQGNYDQLGISASMSGNTIIGGAYQEDGANNLYSDTGAVYIFDLTDKAIFLPTVLKP